MKLNQVIAVEKGIKSKAHEVITEQLNKVLKKADLFAGLTRTYRKINEEDADLPSERKRVQATVKGVMDQLALTWGELITITAIKDQTNTKAKAHVVIDGVTVLQDIPVATLLFLEKQAVDLRTVISEIPTLDEAETWTLDPTSGQYKSELQTTHKSKKIEKVLILYEATKEHPAQTKIVGEDIIAGYWDQYKFSGAIPKPEKDALAVKAEKLVRALKEAREEANSAEVLRGPEVGKIIFQYLLG